MGAGARLSLEDSLKEPMTPGQRSGRGDPEWGRPHRIQGFQRLSTDWGRFTWELLKTSSLGPPHSLNPNLWRLEPGVQDF